MEKKAEEKAKELVKKMYRNIFDGGNSEEAIDAWGRAKQCAIICCEEIIKHNPVEPNDGGEYWGKQAKEFWEQVITEINKL